MSTYVGTAACLAESLPVPQFSHPHGFYDAPFSLAVSTPDPEAIIRFTTDGREPTSDVGQIYAGPLAIAATTCVRAAAFGPDGACSPVVTCTYLVEMSDALRSLPVLSIVGDPDKTFYGPDGICAIQGGQYTDGYVSWRPVEDGEYNHPLERGRAWERPVSVELVVPDGTEGFQVDCGIRVNGSTYTRSRYRPGSKFSFRLYFRDEYGCRRLAYPLIPDAPVAYFDRVVLRAGQSDARNPFIKDELGRRLQRDMSDVACLGTFVNLFVNGQYQGYYNPTERLDEKMFQSRCGGAESWDVVTQWRPEDDDYDWQSGDPVDRPYRFDVRDGDPNNFTALLDYALGHDLSIPEHYSYVAARLDIVQFIDYLILEGYLSHRDWPHNNWTAARARSTGSRGQWRFYAWDLEHSFYISDVDGSFKMPSSGGGIQPVGVLYEQLKVNDEFRRCYVDRVQRHVFNGGALAAEHVTSRFDQLRTTMAGVLPDMDKSIGDVWASQRPAVVVDFLRSNGLFTFEGPRLLVDGQSYRGEAVQQGDVVTLDNSLASGAVFYTLDGSDLRLVTSDDLDAIETDENVANAPRGSVTYDYWLDIPGASLSDLTDSVGFPASPTGSESLPYFESPVRWADDLGGRIYGYLYPPVTGAYTFWIASDNDGVLYLSVDADPCRKREIARLSGWASPQQWDKFASQESAPMALEAGRRYYIEALYKEATGGDHVAVAWEGPGLGRQVIDGAYLGPAEIDWADCQSSDGYAFGAVAPQAIEYDSEPIALDGRTVVKARILDEGLWSGLTEVVFNTGTFVLINEVMADNVETLADPNDPDAFPDWIELWNPTDSAVDLGGLYVTDDALTPLKYRIPAGTTIGAGAFLLLWADGDPVRGPDHLPFKIDRDGEAVGLYDARAEQWIDFISVPALAPDQSFGRRPGTPDVWTTEVEPSPGRTNGS